MRTCHAKVDQTMQRTCHAKSHQTKMNVKCFLKERQMSRLLKCKTNSKPERVSNEFSLNLELPPDAPMQSTVRTKACQSIEFKINPQSDPQIDCFQTWFLFRFNRKHTKHNYKLTGECDVSLQALVFKPDPQISPQIDSVRMEASVYVYKKASEHTVIG